MLDHCSSNKYLTIIDFFIFKIKKYLTIVNIYLTIIDNYLTNLVGGKVAIHVSSSSYAIHVSSS